MLKPNRAARNRAAAAISRSRARAEVDADSDQVYEAAKHRGQLFRRWPVRLQSADRDYLPARHDLVGRARDQFRNEPIAASAVARKKNAAIGKGWRFSSKPDARALGISPEQARELGNLINTEWRIYANSYNFLSDAERRQAYGQQLRVAASHLMMDGEFLAQVDYADDDDIARYKTCLRLIDPDRLSTPLGMMDGDTIRAGVEVNARNVPVAYHIRERHPVDIGISTTMRWVRHPRYSTALGRPNILHGFDADRAGQTRGITRFAAALKAFRGFAKFTDATIKAAAINALILGFVQSSAGPDAVSESFTFDNLREFEADREAFYDKNPVEMDDVRMPVFPLGDEPKLATASKDVTSFEPFVRAIIRLIAASLGVTYEELSMDYSQTNYSSARAAMIHAWNDTVAFMGTIEAQLVRPFFVAWLEEAFDEGYIVPPAGAPDFYDAVDAYAAGRWLGPGRGYIDPTKEILAAAARIEAGISTLEDECAEQGKDYEEVMDQQAIERDMRKARGMENQADAQAKAAQAPVGATSGPAPEDERPTQSALASIAGFANSADHEAFLDRRPDLV